MNQNNKDLWEIGIGVAAPILTVIGILVGVWTFIEGEKNKVRLEYELLSNQSSIDFQREIWKEQLDTYKKTSQLAGEIVVFEGDEKLFEKLINNFHASYWGVMILIEDRPVEQKMIEFKVEIRDFLLGRSSRDRLKKRARGLVEACKESSELHWKKISGSVVHGK